MENLVEFTQSTLAAAGAACTPCLIKWLSEDSAEISGIVSTLSTAQALSRLSPDYMDEFADALAQFLTRFIEMAAFAAELTSRPGVRWIDESTEVAFPIVIIPN